MKRTNESVKTQVKGDKKENIVTIKAISLKC